MSPTLVVKDLTGRWWRGAIRSVGSKAPLEIFHILGRVTFDGGCVMPRFDRRVISRACLRAGRSDPDRLDSLALGKDSDI